jgi:DNA-binding HxlR family transcriptional regulator
MTKKKVKTVAKLQPCQSHEVMARLGDKWALLVIITLSRSNEGRLRFSELKNGIAKISQRMLTLTLRGLERDGLINRHYYAEVPPRVEYELSPMGKSLVPSVMGLAYWINDHWKAITEFRETFDKKIKYEPRLE